MRVMVLVKASKQSEAGEMPSEQLFKEMGDYNEELAKAGILLSGEGLHPTSKGVRIRFSGKERMVTDGPFTETNELVAGYWIWKVKSMEEAIAWLKRCPNPHPVDCDVEIRQIFEADDFGAAFTPELREQEARIRAQTLGLKTLRFEQGRDLLIAGICEHYTCETRTEIPSLWDRFIPHLGKVPGQAGSVSYGVSFNYDKETGFDYIAGVEVRETTNLPANFRQIELPARRYAVIEHEGPVSSISTTIDTIWKNWVPESGLKVASAPCFEVYTDDFDPAGGGMEIWIPLD